jgi:hypothetical protein
MSSNQNPRTYSAFIPVALLLAATLTWSVFQWRQLVAERANITSLRAAQQPQIVQAQKLRAQLDSIATGMQELASKGNRNAAVVVEELRKRGVTISPPGQTPGTAPPAAK